MRVFFRKTRTNNQQQCGRSFVWLSSSGAKQMAWLTGFALFANLIAFCVVNLWEKDFSSFFVVGCLGGGGVVGTYGTLQGYLTMYLFVFISICFDLPTMLLKTRVKDSYPRIWTLFFCSCNGASIPEDWLLNSKVLRYLNYYFHQSLEVSATFIVENIGQLVIHI